MSQLWRTAKIGYEHIRHTNCHICAHKTIITNAFYRVAIWHATESILEDAATMKEHWSNAGELLKAPLQPAAERAAPHFDHTKDVRLAEGQHRDQMSTVYDSSSFPNRKEKRCSLLNMLTIIPYSNQRSTEGVNRFFL